MRRLLLYFLILLLAVWIGLKIQADPGYVLVIYRNTSIETTLWFALLSVILGFLLLYFLMRIIHTSRILPKTILIWWHKRSEQKALKITNIGVFKFAEEKWDSAERLLIKAARDLSNPFMNYIKAAYAAQKQAAYRRRDTYLSKACESEKKAEFYVGIMQAKMQFSGKQLEQALATLKRLQEIKPHHRTVLKLLKEIYLTLNDWQNLKNLLSDLKRYHVLPKADFDTLKQTVYLELLRTGCSQNPPEIIHNMWEKLPKDLMDNPALVFCYAKYLIKNNLMSTAEKLVYQTLKKEWSANLLALFPETINKHRAHKLATIEKCLDSHPNDANLLLCLGRICKKQELWGKARKYFEDSIQLSPSAQAYLELGEVLEKYGTDEQQSACECYRNGLKNILDLRC